MNTFIDSSLIASAPAEILIGLGLFFCIAGLILLVLSVEERNYPQFRRWIKRVATNCRWARGGHRRWWFAPNACSTVGQGNYHERYL